MIQRYYKDLFLKVSTNIHKQCKPRNREYLKVEHTRRILSSIEAHGGGITVFEYKQKCLKSSGF